MKRILSFALLLSTLWISSAWAKVLDKDTIIAATSAAGGPPYEYFTPEGKLAGFDIDLVEEIASILGKKVEWKNMVFDSVLPSLMTGKVDIVAADLNATEERKKKIAFSDVYEKSMSSFIIYAPLEGTIKTIDDLKGKTVAVSMGTLQQTYMSTNLADEMNVKIFPRGEECAREVSLGRADAILIDKPVAMNYLNHREFNGKLAYGFDFSVTDTGKALGINKDEPEFLAAVNKALVQMKTSGKLAELKAKWGVPE